MQGSAVAGAVQVVQWLGQVQMGCRRQQWPLGKWATMAAEHGFRWSGRKVRRLCRLQGEWPLGSLHMGSQLAKEKWPLAREVGQLAAEFGKLQVADGNGAVVGLGSGCWGCCLAADT